ncbi:hypothetical protein BD413DRAFT_617293 [Trametes elegans]|nr:hypothetical protein BD413DRAFT_617293 [Trametes elegans]
MAGGGFSRASTTENDPYTLGDFCIDEYRPVKVIVIGAGFSGITAGIRFPQKIPNVNLTIYEKSAGVGGTWHNNNYPGLACDVPAHSYQLTFQDKRDWSAFYAPGPEIRQHLQDTVDKYKLMRYIKLNHEVVHAQYDESSGKWQVRVRIPSADAPETFEEVEDSCDILMTAFGAITRWKLPDIEGLRDFKGELHHSAGFDPKDKKWEDVVETWKGKKVGVIGAGSSGVQVVSALQPRVKKLVNYVRGKTWVAVPFGIELLDDLIGRRFDNEDDFRFTQEEIERFRSDSDFFWHFRRTIDDYISHAYTIRGSELQLKFHKACREHMEQKLAKKPWIAEALIPNFSVSCKRLTPGAGYLEALCADNADFVSSPIKRITDTGIETTDGHHEDLDVIFCATGYDTSFQLPFKIIGRNGTDLNQRWSPHPVTYLSVAVDEFPNMFISLGPNSILASGVLLAFIEAQVMYAVQATAKLQRERLKSIEVKASALQDFDQYLESYFPKTVFTDDCRSWYKMGKAEGRVVGLWPGSVLHGLKTLMHPRWEDYDYELAGPTHNRLYWLGDGQTWNEKTLTGDRAWYLREPFLDIPPGGYTSRNTTTNAAETPQTSLYEIGDFCIDEYRPIKVVVIGAGFSGITAGVRFPQKIPGLDLTIYEKSAGVGGTWYNNKYPGLACDIPAHCYQLTFEEKRDWSSLYAPGAEIRAYLQGIADKYKLERYLKLQHEVLRAQYDEPAGKWRLRVRRPSPDGAGAAEEFDDSADVLVTAVGSLSRWKWPDIDGLHDFKGELHHSAGFDVEAQSTWQEAWKDKRVGIIGVGSSALQLVPALQPRVKKIVNYVRGQTWLSSPFASTTFVELLGRDAKNPVDYRFTAEELERFRSDPEFYAQFRFALETEINSLHSSTIRGTPMQLQAQDFIRNSMKAKLAKKPWIAEKLIPDFPVACRRLTPGPGYLEALCEDNVDFVSAPIKRITEHGIETADGKHQDLDVLFCATGYDTTFQLPFKIIGRDGLDLNDKWSPHPVSYLSIAVDGFPNMFMSFGPNSGVGSGSLLALFEYQIGYAVQAVAKMQRERLKSMEVKARAVRDFDQYIDAYFPKTVYSEKCRSWYKMGKEEGRVAGLWPGSTLHALKTLSNPRWEDYEYELADPVENRLHWLGDGQTHDEKALTGDRAWYLRKPFLDIPPVPTD